ncbi:MAG: hypothetical protein HRU13_00140 [Phycisphaerales bacterium]|nr:hypothetical protein [Phycisphaerales bacterium]
MSAIPAVRAPAESSPLIDLARVLWPDASKAWGLAGGVLEGVRSHLHAEPMMSGDRPIWPERADYAAPVVIAGLACARPLARAIRERTGAMQYLPRVLVVEPRAEVALASLARLAASEGEAGVRELLHASGVEWFMGPTALGDLQRWLAQHVDDPRPKSVLDSGAPPEVASGIGTIMADAQTRQQVELRELMQALRRTASDRTKRDAVRNRWRSGEALRLSVYTCRYSTYMRHAAADLVAVLQQLGHEAALLVEPDDHTGMTQLHYLRAVRDFEPDGVVLVNYLRPQIGPVLPPYVPVITWSQDAMSHFFVGAEPPRATAQDFVAGLLYPEQRDRLGIPESRMLPWPIPVSPAKFHRAPVGGGYEHLRCDVAFVTRHSEAPQAYAERQIEQNKAQPQVARSIESLALRMPAALERARRERLWLVHALRDSCSDALRDGYGRSATQPMVEGLLQQIALPLVDLYHRQQAVRWAASACERNGWRLHLYGRGWEDHPDLARHARGELEHGEELRAAYQLAGITIHASVRGLLHQRVAEIAMSGGLPIVRRNFEDIDRARWFQLNTMVGGVEPVGHTEDGRPEFAIADHPELMRVASLWGRCGRQLGEGGRVSPTPYEMGILKNCPLGKPRLPHQDPGLALVDVGEIGFETEAELESVMRRSMDERWRSAWSAAIDARMRERFSMDRFASDMVDLVRRSFA